MIKVFYRDNECGDCDNMSQKVFLIRDNKGNKYGIANCPAKDYYFRIDIDEDFEAAMEDSEAIKNVPQEAARNLIKVIQDFEVMKITPELVFAVTHK